MKCPVYKKCGGCFYLHDNYKATLEKKKTYLEKVLGQKARPVLGAKNPYHYRNKVHGAFSYNRGKILMGMYQEESHSVVEVKNCLIDDERAQAINETVKKLASSFKWKVYDERTGYGFLRSSLVRIAKNTGEILLTIVVNSHNIPSKNNFVKAIRKEHPEITSIVFNINDRKTSMILGKRDIVAFGKGYIIDELLGHRFRISAQSFYQVNTEMTEILYKKAIELLHLQGDELLVDAYCGIGTISLYAAGFVREVLAVESNPAAIKDAIANAKANKIKNVYFTAMDAGEYMQELVDEDVKVDAMIVDPAREGLNQEALDAILDLGPEKLLYISCNPNALKADLEVLEEDYQIKVIQPVDLFCFTGHVETVVLMSKKDK